MINGDGRGGYPPVKPQAPSKGGAQQKYKGVEVKYERDQGRA